MSSANLEIHRRLAEAAAAKEIPRELLAPGFVMENRVSSVTDHEYHGEEGFREWLSDVFEHFAEGAVYEVLEVFASGEDYVAAIFSMSGVGAFSDEPLQFRWAGVTWFLHDRAIRAAGYGSRRKALEAIAAG